MSNFVKQALAEKLTRDIREIEGLGYTVGVQGGLVLIEPTGKATEQELAAVAAVAALVTPANDEGRSAKPKVRKKRKKKAAASGDSGEASSEKAGETCQVEVGDGVCGGVISTRGSCPKCKARDYAREYYRKTHAKKA